MHSSASFFDSEGGVRSASDCRVDASTINRSILITDVVIEWMPLLLETVSDVEIVFCDRSWSFNIFKDVNYGMVFEQLLNLGLDIHSENARGQIIGA